MKKLTKLSLLLFSMLLACTFTISIARADSYGAKPKKISAVSKKNVTVQKGQEFELKVQMTPSYAEDDYLEWTIIKGKKVVQFDDSDRDGDEMDFWALKKGTAVIRCKISGTTKKVTFNVTVKSAGKTDITAIGATEKVVRLGNDFDLEVKKPSGLSDRYLKWTIANTKILQPEDGDLTGDDVELYAVQAGTTTVTCQNTQTGKKVSFKIKVTRSY